MYFMILVQKRKELLKDVKNKNKSMKITNARPAV